MTRQDGEGVNTETLDRRCRMAPKTAEVDAEVLMQGAGAEAVF